MKNQNTSIGFLFFSTFFAVLIWIISPNVNANTPASSLDFPWDEYEARYTLSWHGMQAGHSVHKLKQQANGEYHYQTKSAPSVKFLPYHHLEASTFVWQNNQILPLRYTYKIDEGKRRKHGHVNFDWENKLLTNRTLPEHWVAPMPDNVQDKLTQTLLLRQALRQGSAQLTFTVAERDKIREYEFIVLGEERIQTKIGSLSTVKVQHTSRKGHRTITWFAKHLDYLPVKMMQLRRGKIVANGDIESFKTL